MAATASMWCFPVIFLSSLKPRYPPATRSTERDAPSRMAGSTPSCLKQQRSLDLQRRILRDAATAAIPVARLISTRRCRKHGKQFTQKENHNIVPHYIKTGNTVLRRGQARTQPAFRTPGGLASSTRQVFGNVNAMRKSSGDKSPANAPRQACTALFQWRPRLGHSSRFSAAACTLLTS